MSVDFRLEEGFTPDGWFAPLGEVVSPETFAQLALAFAQSTTDAGAGDLLIGYDHTRDWSQYIQAIAQACHAWGCRIAVSKLPCPLPALAHACDTASAVGIYLSAAPLAPEQAIGLRFLTRGGTPPDPRLLELIARQPVRQPSPERATASPPRADFTGPYLDWLEQQADFPSLRRSRLRILIDACGGVTDRLLENVLRKALDKVNTLYGVPLAHFFHRRPVPIETEALELSAQVARGRWDAGILLAGDGSGFGVVDRDGNWLPVGLLILGTASRGAPIRCVFEDPLLKQALSYAWNQPGAHADSREVHVAALGRIRWQGGPSYWDALAGSLLILNLIANFALETPSEIPHEQYRIVPASGAVPLPPMGNLLSAVERFVICGEKPEVSYESFLGKVHHILLDWPSGGCRGSIMLGEGRLNLIVRVLGKELLWARRAADSLAQMLTAEIEKKGL